MLQSDKAFGTDPGSKLGSSNRPIRNLIVPGAGAVLVVHGQTEIATVVTLLSAIAKIIDPWNDMIDWALNFAAARVKYDLIAAAFDQLLPIDAAPSIHQS